MEVFYAVYLRGGVHGEGDAVQTAVANHAGEAAGVVGLPHGTQDPVQDGFGALGTTLQRTLKRREAFKRRRRGDNVTAAFSTDSQCNRSRSSSSYRGRRKVVLGDGRGR